MNLLKVNMLQEQCHEHIGTLNGSFKNQNVLHFKIANFLLLLRSNRSILSVFYLVQVTLFSETWK